MSHPTLEELHDVAYGFRPGEDHVEECAECAKTIETLAREREFVRRALEEPVPARGSRWVPLGAAAALAAALLWTLLPGAGRPDARIPAQPAEPYDIDRFVRELKSPNELRRRTARAALRAHGGAAVEALRKAGETALAEEILRTREEEELLKRLRTIRVSLSFSKCKLEDAVALLRDFSEANFLIAESELAEKFIDAEASDLPMLEAMDRLAKIAEAHWYVKGDLVVFSTKPKPPTPGLVPVRLPVSESARKDAASAVAELADESLDRRDAAEARLLRMGFAAEEALWAGLDSRSPEIAARCAKLLEKLYVPATGPRPLAARIRGLETRMTLDLADVPFVRFIETVSKAARVPIVIDPAAETAPVTIKIKDLAADACLKLVLGMKKLSAVPVGGLLFVTGKEPVRTRFEPQTTLWVAPERAARFGEDVPILRWAGQFDPRYDAEADRLLAKSPGWHPDERRAGGEMFRQLEKTIVEIDADDAPIGDVLKRLGVPIRVAGALPERVTMRGIAPARDVLEVLVRPHGCEYVEKGGEILIEAR